MASQNPARAKVFLDSELNIDFLVHMGPNIFLNVMKDINHRG